MTTVLKEIPAAPLPPGTDDPEHAVRVSDESRHDADDGAGGQQMRTVAIETIGIGPRRRQKLGNLKSLAKSIEQHGLLHPILVRRSGDRTELVAGQRRLAACQLLGWTSVPVRDVTDCDDVKLRAIELEENTERLDLENYEKSKKRLTAVRQEATAARQQASEAARAAAAQHIAAAPDGTPGAAQAEFRSDPKRNSKRGRPKGRPPEPGSKRDVAKRTGISPTEQVRIERHVALAETFPFMQRTGNGWVKHTVLRAGDLLAELPATEHPMAVKLVDGPHVSADLALKVFRNLTTICPECRQAVYEKAQSKDEHERETALAIALRDTLPPDPAIGPLSEMVHLGQRAVHLCRDETLRPEIEQLVVQAERILHALNAQQARRRKQCHDAVTSSATN
jgi:ParB/RepB/Spo0J family partition protein